MQPLLAEIQANEPSTDPRGAARRTLRLEVPAVTSRDRTNALIHNLSETGLLIETSAVVEVGDRLDIDLPNAGPTEARVIWAQGEYVGCEFIARVSKGSVSAALLRAPAETPAQLQLAGAPAALWSDIGDPELDLPAAPHQAALTTSLAASLAVVLAFTAALLSFPFAI